MADLLIIRDPDAAPLFRRQRPRLHLLLDDSIARDCGLETRLIRDAFLRRARGGATWRSLRRDLQDFVKEWDRVAADRGRLLGTAVVWMTGNEMYSRLSGLGNISKDALEEVANNASDVVRRLLEVAEAVLVFGPLPRLSGETMGTRWEQTTAFHLERRLYHQLPQGARLIRLGRQLTRKAGGRYSCIKTCSVWYKEDGVHVSAAGFRKLADAAELPVWLRMAAAHST